MRKLILLCFLIPVVGFGQDDKTLTETHVNTKESSSHIWFLASDELRGRETGTPEIDIAARYIADQFRKYGVQPIDGSYYQEVPLQAISPPAKGSIVLEEIKMALGRDFIMFQAAPISETAEVLYAPEGNLEGKKVEGKIVVTVLAGDAGPGAAIGQSRQRAQTAREMGALAIIELYNLSSFPWDNAKGYLNRTRLGVDQSGSEQFPHAWIHDAQGSYANYFKKNKKVSLTLHVEDNVVEPMPSRNVVGIIEGSDPQLKDEYVLLSAHYDHVGVKEGGAEGEDVIFNGARDNAIGVAAILSAAQSMGAAPAKRSIVLLACTGEEKGLLGSRYFADHPPVPLRQIVYNLNIDGGGYNDVTKVSVMGLNRTTAGPLLVASAEAFGLEAFADPAPEQNLFDRSDNVSFAAKGIPAPTYSTGFTDFDAEIRKYYHQVTDEPESLDFEYLAKYFKAYALAVRLVANMPEAPFWIEGDKYEAAGKELYGK